VEVTVIDPFDAPSLGANVSLSAMRFVNDPRQMICGMTFTQFLQSRTDYEGKLAFEGVGAGPVVVSASQPFFPAPVGQQGTLSSDGQVLRFDLKLKDTTAGILSGTVYGPDGTTRAPAGVRVTITGQLPEITVTTKSDGTYRFAHILPAGRHTLTLFDPASGAVAQDQVFLQTAQDTTMDLRLLGRGTVRVHVVGGDGTPVDRAYLKLTESSYPRRTLEAVIEPGDDGATVFYAVNQGTFSVVAQSTYGRGGRASGTMPMEGAEIEVPLILTPTGTVTGHFLQPLPSSDPIPFGLVRLTVNGKLIGQKATDGEGDVGLFEFENVPAGNVSLEAQDPLTGRTGSSSGSLREEGEILALDIRAQALGTVQGSVTSNDILQAGVDVTILNGSYKARTMTDGQGAYRVEGVPEGWITVKASLALGFLEGSAQELLEGEDAVVTIPVALRASGAVEGQIESALPGDPPLPSTVTLRLSGTQLSTLSRVDGSFGFTRVPAGSGTLDVNALGSIDEGHATVTVPVGGTATPTVKLNGVGSLLVRAFDSNGIRTTGKVKLAGTGSIGWTTDAEVGTTGEVTLPALLAGPASVKLEKKIGGITLEGLAQVVITPGAQSTVNVQLEPAAAVTGSVRRSDGTTPAQGAEVALTLYEGNVTIRTQAGTDGAFHIGNLPLGGFTLRVTDPIYGGRALVTGQALTVNGQSLDLGTIVLDEQAPRFTVVEPVAGSTRTTFAGRLVFDVSDQGTGLVLSTLRVGIPGSNLPYTVSSFAWDGLRASVDTPEAHAVAGPNVITFEVEDVAGNKGTGSVGFLVAGGSVHGLVRRPGVDGAEGPVVSEASVKVGDRPAVITDGTGAYAVTGVRPGNVTIVVTDPVPSLPTTTSITLGDGADQEKNITLGLSGGIHGRISDREDGDVTGAVVTLGDRTVTVDATGAYAFENLTTGVQHTISVKLRNRLRARVRVTIPASTGDWTENITLEGVGTVRILVTEVPPVPP
jgi:hypothetical protein